MLSLGIDYEAGQWKLAAWNEDRAADLHVFDSEAGVWESVEDILTAHPAAPIVLPSGFGIPVTRAGELLDRDIAEITLHPEAHVTDPLGRFQLRGRNRSDGVLKRRIIMRPEKAALTAIGQDPFDCSSSWQGNGRGEFPEEQPVGMESLIILEFEQDRNGPSLG